MHVGTSVYTPKIRDGQQNPKQTRHNPYGLESAKPDLQSGFKKPAETSQGLVYG